MERNVTMTPFVVDLSHSELSNFYMTCEIDVREGSESLALICAFFKDISQENEREALGTEYFYRVGTVRTTIPPLFPIVLMMVKFRDLSHCK